MRTFSKRHVAAVSALLAIACLTPTEADLSLPDVVGRYELVSVGGKPLPAALPLDGPPRYYLTADTLWLRADSTYEEHMVREVIVPVPLVLKGRFSIAGSTIRLVQNGGTPTVASLRDSTLTVGDSPSSAAVYLRGCAGVSC